MSQTTTDLVTPEMLKQYRNEGYFVLEGAMTGSSYLRWVGVTRR